MEEEGTARGGERDEKGGDGKKREGEPKGEEGTRPPSRPHPNPYFWICPWYYKT